MLRSRRELLHCNGITDLDMLQPTFATKSATTGREQPERILSVMAVAAPAEVYANTGYDPRSQFAPVD